ncbi:MAG: hypothetical protein ACKV19_18245 [Verrucomicrobiales bacterium]
MKDPLPILISFAISWMAAPVALSADPIALRAGPVTMSFDAENAFLRYVRVGPHEVLRGINTPVRNQNWATVAPKVSNLVVDDGGDKFSVTFDVRCAEEDIDFRWKGTLTGSTSGVVEFSFDGEAHSTFKRNRIGFCVLHGPSAAGQPWVIETADGKRSTGLFPRSISPHQPAKNLRAITHEIAAGLRARVDFEGEVFEMEDQRNWTDGSFKTYCTPLEIPYPVEIAKGTRISQKIKISLAGDVPASRRSGADEPVVLTLSDKRSALPRLGLQVSGEVKNLTASQINHLKALHLDHLRVDLALSREGFADDLHRAAEQARALGVSLHVALNLGKTPAFGPLLDVLRKSRPPVSHWLITGGDPAHFQTARTQLAPVVGNAKIGVTQTTNFVDLNRKRPDDAAIQVVGFAINPQIHAFDIPSMVETLEIQADAVTTAREFTGERSLAIGPVTLRPQLVDGKAPPGGPPAGPFPTQVDERQGTPFTAAWTLGSVKFLAAAGADSATYYETVGWNGVIDADTNTTSARPAGFPSQPGVRFPVYHLLAHIGEFASGTVRHIESSDPLQAVAIVLQKPGRRSLLVGNLTGTPLTPSLRGLGPTTELRYLSGGTKAASPQLPVELPPYGIALVELPPE